MLTEILQRKLLPWSIYNARERFIVTHPDMRQQEMPYGVRLSPRKVKGKRVIVKDNRIYKNSRHITAHWPESGLIEVQKYKLMCVLDGAIDYPIGNYSLQCGPAHFIFIPPGLPQSNGSASYVDHSKSTFCKVLFFLLHSNAIQYWVTQWERDHLHRPENALISDQRATLIFHTLMEEVYEQEEPSTTAQEALLVAFFSLLKREADAGYISYLYGHNLNTATDNRPAEENLFGFRSELERYIKVNINKPITIQDAARALYLSRAQFTRTVRRETGMSFNEFLNAYRIEQAKELLRNTDWTVSFIAESVGFTSSNYFRTFFRKHTGKTPGEFRSKVL